MPLVNVLTEGFFEVRDIGGALVTTLVQANFTITLERYFGGTFIPAAEAVTIANVGGGRYRVTFTPTSTGAYRLTVSHATHLVGEQPLMFDVLSGLAAQAGPYLTSRSSYKTRFGVKKADGTDDTGFDTQIDQLLPVVTRQIENHCDIPSFSQWTGDEYPAVREGEVRRIPLDRYPVGSITGVWISTSFPRVYDASTLLTENVDFMLDPGGPGARPAIVLVGKRWFCAPTELAVKVSYSAGYAVIPTEIEEAANIDLESKLRKATEHSYDVSSRNLGDGAIEYQTKLDLCPEAVALLAPHRRIGLA